MLRYDVPEDGLPSIDDWLGTFTSILLDGLELQREPLDVSVDHSESNMLNYFCIAFQHGDSNPRL